MAKEQNDHIESKEYTELSKRIDRLQLTIQATQKEELNVHEAAALLGYKNSKSLYNLYYDGVVPGYKIEGKLYFKKKDII